MADHLVDDTSRLFVDFSFSILIIQKFILWVDTDKVVVPPVDRSLHFFLFYDLIERHQILRNEIESKNNNGQMGSLIVLSSIKIIAEG